MLAYQPLAERDVIVLAERRDARWAHPGVLAAALLLASASVALWWGSELAGRSDLRAPADWRNTACSRNRSAMRCGSCTATPAIRPPST